MSSTPKLRTIFNLTKRRRATNDVDITPRHANVITQSLWRLLFSSCVSIVMKNTALETACEIEESSVEPSQDVILLNI